MLTTEQLALNCFLDALNDPEKEWKVHQGKPKSMEGESRGWTFWRKRMHMPISNTVTTKSTKAITTNVEEPSSE
ncbi:hypothetical protein CHS0354_012143 [Potamilus streckersoni]|uniref:Uncharacterized protein n=1 Tax=Potamilus streckersoni TaxID=2493646 RepID=A0AAE0SA67_9BIVA|nr:hypothetical protein CHS0354_012143 [Potamilus streckersoni]